MIHTGTYPLQLKITKVTPIFKANDKEHFSNYRPISLLPSISKIFESVIYQQLIKYLLENCCVWTIILLYTCITTINHCLCIDESLLLFPLLHATIDECSTCL